MGVCGLRTTAGEQQQQPNVSPRQRPCTWQVGLELRFDTTISLLHPTKHAMQYRCRFVRRHVRYVDDEGPGERREGDPLLVVQDLQTPSCDRIVKHSKSVMRTDPKLARMGVVGHVPLLVCGAKYSGEGKRSARGTLQGLVGMPRKAWGETCAGESSAKRLVKTSFASRK